MMLTLREAKKLKHGDVLVNMDDGKRWRVSGKVKTWKKDARRIRVPLKHGLYSYDALQTEDFDVDGNCYYLRKEDRGY
jgi:hypothetical protein